MLTTGKEFYHLCEKVKNFITGTGGAHREKNLRTQRQVTNIPCCRVSLLCVCRSRAVCLSRVQPMCPVRVTVRLFFAFYLSVLSISSW